ncbi:MAG: biotin synthase BioB [Gammaproteobacteria bacterium]
MRVDTCSQAQVNEPAGLRHDWVNSEVKGLFGLPFNDLIFQAQTLHRQYFDPNEIQLSALLNIKEGGCPEDCAYCPQSARYKTSVEAKPLMTPSEVTIAARSALAQGASRFCMGGAWRGPRENDFMQVLEIIREVKALGMETCATLGMLTQEQAERLKQAGLDYYNHNLDTSASYYPKIITTRSYKERIQTLEHVRNSGLKVCCGGIVGMGEGLDDRVELLMILANMPVHPESVPINLLVRIEGTPLQETEELDPFVMVRTIAVARILMPASYVRLSAGRAAMTDTMQALCFHAGANSIFYGDKLLTTENPGHRLDMMLFKRLGLRAKRYI